MHGALLRCVMPEREHLRIGRPKAANGARHGLPPQVGCKRLLDVFVRFGERAVLVVKPGFERSEVVQDRRVVDLVFARHGLERFRLWLAGT